MEAISESETVICNEYVNNLLQSHIAGVCRSVMDTPYSQGPYGQRKPHEDLLSTCKAYKRDTTELERAMSAHRDAVMHLKHVTDIETLYLRKASEAHLMRPRAEDLT